MRLVRSPCYPRRVLSPPKKPAGDFGPATAADDGPTLYEMTGKDAWIRNRRPRNRRMPASEPEPEENRRPLVEQGARGSPPRVDPSPDELIRSVRRQGGWTRIIG
jgi:hypothetical protein